MDRRQILLLLGSAALPSLARAQQIGRIFVGFPPGGSNDRIARAVAAQIRPTSRQFIVESKAGAAGRIAVDEIKRWKPDGSAILQGPGATFTLFPHVYKKLSYTVNDVTPVCAAATTAFGLGVGPSVPERVQNVEQYLQWARSKENTSSYASPGTGTTPHLIGAFLAKRTGVNLVHVPYRGSAPGIQDLIGGQVDAMITPIGDYFPYLESGRLRLLAMTGAERSRNVPKVATFSEQGYKAFVFTEWYGFFLPAGASDQLATEFAKEIRRAAASEKMVTVLGQLGLEQGGPSTPVETLRALKEDTASWGRVVIETGFQPEE